MAMNDADIVARVHSNLITCEPGFSGAKASYFPLAAHFLRGRLLHWCSRPEALGLPRCDSCMQAFLLSLRQSLTAALHSTPPNQERSTIMSSCLGRGGGSQVVDSAVLRSSKAVILFQH